MSHPEDEDRRCSGPLKRERPPDDLLSPPVRALFADLAHAGDLPASRGQVQVQGDAGREQRGTRVRFSLCLEGGAIRQAGYSAYGCPHTLAVCEWLARRLEAGHWASLGGAEDWCRALEVPMVKLGRLLVVEDALRAALAAATLSCAVKHEIVVK